MMTTDDSIKLAASYLSGNASGEERLAFESWLHESPGNQEMFKEFQKIWKHSSIRFTIPDADTPTEWRRLQRRIDDEKTRSPLTLFFSHHGLKIAASLIVILVAYWLLKPDTTTSTRSAAMTVIESEKEESVIYLPDSSKVHLGTFSSLSYDETFGNEIREVKLNGQGYFEVNRDTAHPFFVVNEWAVVRVVGTSFQVKDEDSVVTVAVSEGVVRLYARDIPVEAITLSKGEKGYLRKEETKPEKVSEKVDRSISPTRRGNSVYEKEAASPLSYLSTKFTWKKNQFNQSVIDGTIVNSASLASFKNIELKVQYTKPNGKEVTTFVTVYESISPSDKLTFHTKLMDVFANVVELKVSVNKAETDISSDK